MIVGRLERDVLGRVLSVDGDRAVEERRGRVGRIVAGRRFRRRERQNADADEARAVDFRRARADVDRAVVETTFSALVSSYLKETSALPILFVGALTLSTMT